jgi:hypothetical protein
VQLVGGIAKIPAESVEIERILAVALDGVRYPAGQPIERAHGANR